MLRSFPLKASRSTGTTKITRLRAQPRALRVVNGFALCLLGLSIGGLVVAGALPQMRQHAEKKRELEAVLERERAVMAEKEDTRATHDALRHDTEYLELHARDRLNLHKPGETIYRMERDP
jgi:cell division protein FtsB